MIPNCLRKISICLAQVLGHHLRWCLLHRCRMMWPSSCSTPVRAWNAGCSSNCKVGYRMGRFWLTNVSLMEVINFHNLWLFLLHCFGQQFKKRPKLIPLLTVKADVFRLACQWVSVFISYVLTSSLKNSLEPCLLWEQPSFTSKHLKTV